MSGVPPLLVNIKSSALKLYFFVAAHVFSVVSILLITDSGLISSVLKILLILFVLISFKYYLSQHRSEHCLYLKTDNQVDLSFGGRDYYDLQLSSQSYVSDRLMLLFFSDSENDISHSVSIFPDSIDAATHSQLRAWLKLASNKPDIISV